MQENDQKKLKKKIEFSKITVQGKLLRKRKREKSENIENHCRKIRDFQVY